MANFSDFIQTEKSKEDVKSSTTHTSAKSNNSNMSNEKLEDMINKYSEYSNDKLLEEFMKLTIEKKKKGELTESELNNIKNTILPFLNDEQKKNLDNIIKMVKNV